MSEFIDMTEFYPYDVNKYMWSRHGAELKFAVLEYINGSSTRRTLIDELDNWIECSAEELADEMGIDSERE